MPVLKRDDAEIYFEEFGSGYPVLLFAPGGLRSRIEMWHAPAEGPARPWNDWTEELESRYRVIAMDQRNAGRSRGAIAANHGWHTYAADHLALMDHLGFKQFHIRPSRCGSCKRDSRRKIFSRRNVLCDSDRLAPLARMWLPEV